MAYKHYTDEEKAVAMAYLVAGGYPDKPGALADASYHTGISKRQLQRLWRGDSDKPDDKIVAQKVPDVQAHIATEIEHIFEAMGLVREDASYRDLGWVLGVLIDKWQLLSGGATERIEEKTVNVNWTRIDYRADLPNPDGGE